jgi:hypothetical protein
MSGELVLVLEYIVREVKRELMPIGVFMLSIAPIFFMLKRYGICADSIVMIVIICSGWALIFVSKVIDRKNNIFGIPIAKKRFTHEKDGVIIINVSDINEISEYLYSLEEYLEKVGKNKWG